MEGTGQSRINDPAERARKLPANLRIDVHAIHHFKRVAVAEAPAQSSPKS